ncbi:polyamine aminopropyltransferase [Marinobacter nanhaiticus D15-8W]|uniref:Polyamine aminopropyltransferase n=1 Tax=Marinobacter nanhaiticus D15-8W TaxID=626887 RepID=N6VSK8_9GAMM|nr:polyamine aminopropyltransferase [Marinobacter nanhaiticus]ENO13140.2 polyamine aminopropyltransferase [Marinobacter nanhaiticus D15-8W]BES70498.1 polyamine aminopropyltransferase [Marinobacter nanhaiticus D15-8W]
MSSAPQGLHDGKSAQHPRFHRQKQVLIGSILIAGLCSIIYELLISTTASYFLGDSVRQFSITIGVYMAAMGLGSWLSRWVNGNLLMAFIAVELVLGLIGGLCVPFMYLAYAYTDLVQPVMLLLILTVGTLTGLEVPLLTRLLEHQDILARNLSNVLSLDYLGALLATLAFPFLVLPWMGVFQSSLVFGLLNIGLGLLNLWYFAPQLDLSRKRLLGWSGAMVTSFLVVLLVFSQGLLSHWTNSLYSDRVVHREQTPYQTIVLTQYKDDIRLFLNGNLQFSSVDEYRYHEALVHIPLSQHEAPRRVLLLGAGDGMAARELLKYPEVQSITMVDLDPAVVRLARTDHRLAELNQGSLDDPRVTTVAQDAMVFLKESDKKFDIILADLPDPNNVSLARLYSREFYRLVDMHLAPGGSFTTQATSPYFATKAFWSVHASLAAAGFERVVPYHVQVPSFGEWGFVYASHSQRPLKPEEPSVQTRFLDNTTFAEALTFPRDLKPTSPVEVSSLDDPTIHDYYMDGWTYWH